MDPQKLSLKYHQEQLQILWKNYTDLLESFKELLRSSEARFTKAEAGIVANNEELSALQETMEKFHEDLVSIKGE